MPSSRLGLSALCALVFLASSSSGNRMVERAGNITVPTTPRKDGCRYIPQDPEWPSSDQWDALNRTVDGRLIATVPAGAPCYRSTFDVKTQKYDLSATEDQAACAAVQKGWHDPAFHEESSSSIMQTYFANNSCNPIADQSGGKCGIGSYVQYAIKVTGDEDARAGISFARRNNIRLIIRNTGHEFVPSHVCLVTFG